MPDITPHAFVAKWRNDTRNERQASQEHFIDLCRLIGHATPGEADPVGTWFTFEKGASKATGGEGFADVWKMGYFGWEYKGRHGDLDKAYRQLLQYREDLLNPPLLVVCDLQRIIVHTNFTNTVKREHKLDLDDLLKPEGLELLSAVFTDPESLRDPQTPEHVTQLAAEKFAHLSERLRSGVNGAPGHPSEVTAHFLIRLLFCLFAEDANILPNRLFTQLVTRWGGSPAQFAKRLKQLFAAMADGGPFGAEEIPNVDGGLFEDDAVLPLDGESLRILTEVSGLDWSAIEPSVLGTLFERSLDPDKRSQLGAHYTGKDDILLIVEPVLMAPLRREWAAVKAQAEGLAEKRETVRGSKPSAQKTKQLARLDAELRAVIRQFRERLAAVQVLDPGCGSGNFLYVSLRQLLDLEHEAINLAVRLGDSRSLPLVSPEQLHGIEINPYAYELAQATIWIGYIQWLRENGYGRPAEPILKPLEAIRRMDAILKYDAEGKPVEPEWPSADVIIGNPPFLGGGKIRSQLGDKYTEDLFKLYGAQLPNFSDLVCYWFEKARAQIAAGKTKRAGLLATQSIRGGANRRVLERIKETGDIFWAFSDRNWVLDGATVHVAMVGFDSGAEPDHTLDGREVAVINPDLTSMIDVTKARRLAENVDICFMGPSPKAPFDIDVETARSMLSAPANINGRPNSDVVRPVASAVDLTQRSRGKWTIDFRLMSLEEASCYEIPFEYVKKHVYPVRSNNRRASYANRWWQYAEARPGMRAALNGKVRSIATPEVSKHRVFVWMLPQVLCNQQTLVFARDDDYFIGVLQSRAHELWARRTGTQLREAESGFRYTPTTTFETYPFPWPPGKEPTDDPRVIAIADAARDLVAKRDAWLNPPGASEAELKKRTLTNLYNARPEWLKLSHRKLDEAVLAAYGWPADLT
ncbi:MAG: class I SAM-dependent DNA methyltransferase, partial [Nitrososphaerales archaeon]